MIESKIIFEETQRFRQAWIWILLAGINLLPFILLANQIIEGSEIFFLKNLISEVIIAAITLLIFNIQLTTQIRTDGIYVRFYPLHRSFQIYKWESIARVFVRRYNPLQEYGGWGFRLGMMGNGRAYNISGASGIQIIFTDGSKLLVGTAQPVEVQEALKRIGILML